MSYRRVSRVALVVLTGALVACSGDQTNPTAPSLDGLASLSGEAKPDQNPGAKTAIMSHCGPSADVRSTRQGLDRTMAASRMALSD